mmetsp:Transcript_59741/g.173080  ORF Transcript_59741/g.173080 Transcript_59741/m.173080 type:complete len:214 (+) Transcript_59741:218-859(+)
MAANCGRGGAGRPHAGHGAKQSPWWIWYSHAWTLAKVGCSSSLAGYLSDCAFSPTSMAQVTSKWQRSPGSAVWHGKMSGGQGAGHPFRLPPNSCIWNSSKSDVSSRPGYQSGCLAMPSSMAQRTCWKQLSPSVAVWHVMPCSCKHCSAARSMQRGPTCRHCSGSDTSVVWVSPGLISEQPPAARKASTQGAHFPPTDTVTGMATASDGSEQRC